MSRSTRTQMHFADWFKAENGWRALGLVMALALGYNGVAVGVEHNGASLAPFLSSSLGVLAWSNAVWSALFLAVAIVTAVAEIVNGDPSWRAAMQGAVLACFALAGFAVLFSQNPAFTSGRYWIGALGALLAFLAAAREEQVQRVQSLTLFQGGENEAR